MTKGLRYFLFLVSIIEIFFTAAFFFQWPLATQAWPFPGTTSLTYILISSILAAAAASTFWVALTQNYAALAGIGLDTVAVLLPLAIFAFQTGSNGGGTALITFGIEAALLALFGLGFFLWGLRAPLDHTRPMPNFVRWSFMVFVVVLLFASAELIMRVPNVIPWKITPDLSVFIGLIFFGASSYFIYALLRPSWVNCFGQLLAFLVYDVVLLIPLLERVAITPPEQTIGLIVYLAVVIYSGILALYTLLLYRSARAYSKAGS